MKHVPKVHETPLSEEDKMAAGGHRVPVNLWLDVDDALGICLQPGNVDLNIEVPNAEASSAS